MISAVEFQVSVPRYLLVRGASAFSSTAAAGVLGATRLVKRAPPSLPADHWLGIDVIAGGICGTDLACLAFTGPVALEPFSSFPAIMGHEIFGRVAEVGARAEGFSVGDRVVVDPLISCQTRGYAPNDFCGACRRMVPGGCERAGSEGPLVVEGAPLARGSFIGFHTQLTGSWGGRVVAPGPQVFKVPDTVNDQKAALVEPLSVAVHGALGSWQRLADSVLVLGAGPIGLGTVWALRALGYKGLLVVQAKRPPETQLALRLGADKVVAPGAAARDELLALGATPYKPLIGDEVYMGGFDTVFDCVGSTSSFQQALRSTRAGGQVSMLGCCTELGRIDQTFLWARQLEMRGFIAYGLESWQGEQLHTFELTLRLLSETQAPVERMITHDLPLADYKKGLRYLFNRSRSGAIKVLLRPPALG